jgi:hypothetical protein
VVSSSYEGLGPGQGQVIRSFERAGEIAAHLEDLTAEAEEVVTPGPPSGSRTDWIGS